MNYKCFDKYILRTPINSLKGISKDINLDFFAGESYFMQSIRISSPDLYNKFKKFLHQDSLNKSKNKERLLFSLYKYYTRSCTRCTPFGLFAGLNIGKILPDKENKVIIDKKENHFSHTRLDMDYLCALIQNLEKNPDIRISLVYSVNNSLYVVGNKIRYVEYSYLGTNRKYQISSADYNEYLQRIIDKVKKGAKMSEIAELLVDDDITYDEAFEYVNLLIDNQVLVSNLNPTVTGDELHDFLISQLETLNLSNKKILDTLKEIKGLLLSIDSQTGIKAIDSYEQIPKKIRELGSSFDKKYLFQTDLILSFNENIINEKIVNELKEGICILNKLTIKYPENNLSRFKEAFVERYEEQELPLAMVLDVELGIGYLQNNSGLFGDNTPLVDDLVLPYQEDTTQSQKINWNKVSSFLHRKYIEFLKHNEKYIEITDKEVSDFSENWDDLPITFSAMAQIMTIDNKNVIVLDSAGGSSAVNLLGRFAHSDKELNEHITQIVEVEERGNHDKLCAEIVHLPQNRTGNILSRPVFRKYEIPYLAQPSVPIEEQIPIDDIMISIKQGRIVLRSKKYNKEIQPYLSNAHNFSRYSLPIYQFLADMQTQNVREGVTFSWGNLENEYDFLPRVIYKNLIFSQAIWTIRKHEIEPILKLNDNNQIFNEFKKLKQKRNLPKHVVLVDGDNELCLNLNSLLNIRVLLSSVKKLSFFRLKEFLFSENNAFVRDVEGNPYSNEFIFSFYKENVTNA